MLFDRILCDVPCSGDGTIRKAPDIWRRWTPGNGIGLHPLQIRIALQACRLLKVGGRLVYSTCTYNPLEDEAVVSEVGSACSMHDDTAIVLWGSTPSMHAYTGTLVLGTLCETCAGLVVMLILTAIDECQIVGGLKG